MQVAALYQLHGNVPALEAVLEEIQRGAVDAIVFGGDLPSDPLLCRTVELAHVLDMPSREEALAALGG